MSSRARLGRLRDARGDVGYMHYCPGCDSAHAIWVEAPNDLGARWSFDGDMAAPTFQPSVVVTIQPADEARPGKVCHYVLEQGQLRFLPDSTHALRGQTIELPAFPDGW